MIDTKLIADALKKSTGQQHIVANHCTCYRGNMTRYQSDNTDLVSKNEADFHERVLRSFLVTGCIRRSVKIVQTTLANQIVVNDTGDSLEELITEIANCDNTILIADDQTDVLNMLSALLSSLGYNVLLAEDGQDAVEKYGQHRENICLILMDIIMPRKNGIHAYIEIKEMNPDAKIILMTGYDAGHISELSDLKIPVPECVLKPFSPADLIKTITKHLPPKHL